MLIKIVWIVKKTVWKKKQKIMFTLHHSQESLFLIGSCVLFLKPPLKKKKEFCSNLTHINKLHNVFNLCLGMPLRHQLRSIILNQLFVTTAILLFFLLSSWRASSPISCMIATKVEEILLPTTHLLTYYIQHTNRIELLIGLKRRRRQASLTLV